MLIIARRKGQRVVLGPDVEVVVTDVTRTTVKLGFIAPSSCTILRGEVHDSIVEANRGAALSAFDESALDPARPAEQSTAWQPEVSTRPSKPTVG